MPTPSSPLVPDERPAVGADRPSTRFAGRFAPETVLGLVADSYPRLAEHARVRTHLVVPVERLTAEHLTAERLDALAHRAGEHVTASPAGTHPESPTAEVVRAPGIVIPMGCGEACTVTPGRHRYLDRPVADPDWAPFDVIRGIRDAIDAPITEPLTRLAP
ncbi:three-helix bundle dimerization domain-containing protein [Streptomyces erythrochromogenes]|uniref:three-helix bundle dimerization domain-containing protein n=1 Tax=Streptomyces erythrochromogenes TaxID=285574 RepID=UPI0036C1E18E